MNVAELFGESASGYDLSRRFLVSDFDGFYGAALASIPKARDGAFRVLDLGSGTGLLAAMVAEAFPAAHITLADFSGEMMAVARERFSDEPEGRFRFLLMDYSREEIPGEYEVVVSAVSIHHVEDSGKRRVFREVHRVLADGGVFVNAEQILGDTLEIERANHEAWLREARELGASEEDINAALRRMETDECATLDAQIGWMEEAGFTDVERRYENGRFAVYSGRKETS